MANQQLSNVIGAPFAEHVLTQLNLRAAHNSTGEGALPSRSNDEILFLANKMSWVKLTSSVGILPEKNNGNPLAISEYYKKLGLNYANADDLAKNWTLQAGTSKAKGAEIDLRYGLGSDGAYGLGGTEELGYRPMPGLTSVTIDTKGTLGSLREANLQFKVWNMNQLNIIEALYFRLGYSMLLEWGHNQFYTNVGNNGGTFTTNTYGIDPFQGNLRKEKVQQLIAQRSYSLGGNYDGMLGIVTNFLWSFNQTGGYDCTLKLIGLGAIMDSLRINLSYTMPPALFQEYKKQADTIKAEEERLAKIAAANAESTKRQAQGLPNLPATPTNPQEIYTKIYTADTGVSTNPPPGQDTFLADNALPVAYNADPANQVTNTVYDYYYKATSPSNPAFATELNTKRTGLFLNAIPNLRSSWQLVPAENYPAVVLSRGLLNETAIRTNQLNAAFRISNNIYGEVDLGESNLIGNNSFAKAFDYYLYNYPSLSVFTAANSLRSGNGLVYKPDDPVYIQAGLFKDVPLTVALQQSAYVIDPKTKERKINNFIVIITYSPPPDPEEGKEAEDKLRRLTRKELIAAVENWLLSDRKVQITSIENTKDAVLINEDRIDAIFLPQKSVAIKGTFKVSVPGKAPQILDIVFTNTALIESVLASPVAEGTPQNAIQNGTAGDNGGTDNSATPSQTDAGFKFASALHAMLAVVKSQVEYDMSKKPGENVLIAPLTDLTKKFYEGSILEKLFNTTVDDGTSDFNLIQYALKGFNSNLMVNYKKTDSLFKDIPSVNFNELCTAYGIKWTIQDEENRPNHPTYIKLGYLLSFLNAMCLVYDSTQDTDKHPYVYLDFNPFTNFCLTMPEHMSVDPFTCMIPYQGNQLDYLKLFPPSIAPNPDPKSLTIFNENINAVSSYLPKFKVGTNPYQGSTMEILLNIDFLISTLNARTTASKDHVVDLKGFLDDIMTGINKSTGNLNSFRVAYRDDSNTVIIKDDQFVPPMEQEKNPEVYAMNTGASPNNYGVPSGINVPKYGQLPVFGKYSLVREMKFETNMSTAISNVIAISGQSDTTAVNSTDHSSFSWLNTNFEDRYKPKVSNSPDTNSKKNNKTTDEEKKAQEEEANAAADEFNQHVLSIYQGGVALSRKMVSTAINYYINGIAKVKSTNGITLAAPFIPANLNITIDGIAGIVMGNAFTIPEDRLPLSLRGQGGVDKNTKVGFVVVGLSHSLDNNQWLTRIRGQMIKLRDSTSYGITQQLQTLQLNFVTNTTATAITGAGSTGFNNTIDSIPWSAAFISYTIATKAGVSFPSSASHTGYAQAIRIQSSYGWQALDPKTTPLKVGDIVVQNRKNSLTFNTKPWSGSSHGDIIVSINGARATGIGGNVSQSVSQTNFTLTSDGRLGSPNFFVVLRPPSQSAASIASAANVEYQLWKSGNWKEQTAAAYPTLAAYYKKVGITV